MDNKPNRNQFSFFSAFLIGILLFWAFGKGMFDLKSVTIFIAGLIGVAVSVLAFAAYTIYYNSHHKEN